MTTNPLREIEKLKELLRVAKCPACDGSGSIPVQTSAQEYVTRDMAMDAGDLSMEGSLYSEEKWEQQQCQWCDERKTVLNTPASQAGEGTPCPDCGGSGHYAEPNKFGEAESKGPCEKCNGTGATPSPQASAPESPALEALIVRFVCGKGNAWNQVDEEAVQAARVEATRRTVREVDIRKIAEEISNSIFKDVFGEQQVCETTIETVTNKCTAILTRHLDSTSRPVVDERAMEKIVHETAKELESTVSVRGYSYDKSVVIVRNALKSLVRLRKPAS